MFKVVSCPLCMRFGSGRRSCGRIKTLSWKAVLRAGWGLVTKDSELVSGVLAKEGQCWGRELLGR